MTKSMSALLSSAAIIILVCAGTATGEGRGVVPDIADQMGEERYSVSKLDWLMLEYNLSRAYGHDPNILANPVYYDRTNGLIKTHFFVLPSSSLSRMDAATMHATLNSHVSTLLIGLSQDVFYENSIASIDDIQQVLEVEFTTVDDGLLYIIGRYKDGGLSLVREKINFGGR